VMMSSPFPILWSPGPAWNPLKMQHSQVIKEKWTEQLCLCIIFAGLLSSDESLVTV